MSFHISWLVHLILRIPAKKDGPTIIKELDEEVLQDTEQGAAHKAIHLAAARDRIAEECYEVVRVTRISEPPEGKRRRSKKFHREGEKGEKGVLGFAM